MECKLHGENQNLTTNNYSNRRMMIMFGMKIMVIMGEIFLFKV
jgi:hypothetical protein